MRISNMPLFFTHLAALTSVFLFEVGQGVVKFDHNSYLGAISNFTSEYTRLDIDVEHQVYGYGKAFGTISSRPRST